MEVPTPRNLYRKQNRDNLPLIWVENSCSIMFPRGRYPNFPVLRAAFQLRNALGPCVLWSICTTIHDSIPIFHLILGLNYAYIFPGVGTYTPQRIRRIKRAYCPVIRCTMIFQRKRWRTSSQRCVQWSVFNERILIFAYCRILISYSRIRILRNVDFKIQQSNATPHPVSKNDEICIINEKFCIKTRNFASKMMSFAGG